MDERPSQLNPLSAAIDAIDRLAVAVVRLGDEMKRLGRSEESRYTSRTDCDSGHVDEKTMAQELGLPKRTLARYRREGRFPNCWIKNAHRIFWNPEKALAAWKRGIA